MKLLQDLLKDSDVKKDKALVREIKHILNNINMRTFQNHLY